MKKKKIVSGFRNAMLAVAFTFAILPALAQQGGTARYLYDDNGRLRAVISPSGEAAVYDYDAAGNFIAIRRLAADALAILDFFPHAGTVGDHVTLIGVGFGAGVSSVSFNGTAAQIVSSDLQTVTVVVPSGATTGPISVVTSHGTAITTSSFAVRGIKINPAAITIISGGTIQFTASVTIDGNQSVKWSVEGIVGGAISVGTITTEGLYTAPMLSPNVPSTVFKVRATSVVAPSVFGEAQVTVKNRDFFRPIFSSAVAVGFAHSVNANSAVIGAGVTVEHAITQTTSAAPIAAGVSVGHAITQTTSAAPIAAGVSVGFPKTVTDSATPISSGISVGHPTESSTASAISSGGVTAKMDLSISGSSPLQVSRNTVVALTISGVNLTGANAIKFIDDNSSLDATIAVSNVSVNGNGTVLTADLTIGNAALGRRLVIVMTAGSHSQTTALSTNTITIVP